MSTKLLTRRGALQLTRAIDRIATTIQENAEALGIDPKIAKDYAYRSDLLSDAVETTASKNFPITAADKAEEAEEEAEGEEVEKKAADEEGLSVEPDGEGFDATVIGDEVAGPLEMLTPEESWMGGHFTQERYNALGEVQESGQLSAAVKFARLLTQAERVFVGRTAASKLQDITVQGYDQFTDQIRQLDTLNTKAQELQAQIDALVAPLLEEKAGLDKDLKKIHETIKKEYKENLTSIGNITIERKTSLVEARAMLKVTERRGSLDDVQTAMLASVTEKYGDEVAKFVETTTSALRDANQKMVIAFQGFELEAKASRTASLRRNAGLADLLSRFQDMLTKGWTKMVQLIQNAAKIVAGSSRSTEKAHNEFMSTCKDLQSGKTASRRVATKVSDSSGFNLFAK